MTVHEFFARVWQMLMAQGHGPMHIRLILQPLVATLFALRFGIADAREGMPPFFFWTIFTDKKRRAQRLREAWQHVGKLFLAAITLDFIYQLLVYHWIYPTQALVTAVFLAFVPYFLLRGPFTLIARRILKSQEARYAEHS